MTSEPNKSCSEFQELLSAWFDQQLEPDQNRRVEHHLAQCPDCRRRLEDYRRIREMLLARKAPLPRDLAGSVMAQLERDHLLSGLESLAAPPRPRGLRLFKGLAAAATIVIILSASIILIHSGTWRTRARPHELAYREPSPPPTRIDQFAAQHVDNKAVTKDNSDMAPRRELAPDRRTALPAAPQRVAQPPPGKDHGIGITLKPVPAEKAEQLPRVTADRERRGPETATSVETTALGVAATTGSRLPSAPGDLAELVAPSQTAPAEARSICLEAPDASAWMYMRDRVVAALDDSGFQRRLAAAPSRAPATTPAIGAYEVLPRSPGDPQRCHARILVTAEPQRLRHLTDAIERITLETKELSLIRDADGAAPPAAFDLAHSATAPYVAPPALAETAGPASTGYSFFAVPSTRQALAGTAPGPASTQSPASAVIVEIAVRPRHPTPSRLPARQPSSQPATRQAPGPHPAPINGR